MPADSKTEAWLQNFGVENFTLEVLDIANIDRQASLSNQARVTSQPIDDEVVANYALAIEAGAEMPPIVVVPTTNGYKTVDGNHRFVAYDLAGKTTIEAYVLHDTSETQRLLLTFDANTRHGLRTSSAERLAQALTLVANGITPAEAARVLNISPHTLYQRIQAQEAATQLAGEGVDTTRLSHSHLRTLASIRNTNVRTATANWINDQRIPIPDAGPLIQQLNSLGTETEQLRFIEIERGRRAALNRASARGRIQLPTPIPELQRVLEAIDEIAPTALSSEGVRERVPDELRSVLGSRALDGAARLRRIAAALTD